MKVYRLVLESSGEAVSPLHFLDRSDASRYQKILLWPWETLGYFQADSGEKWPLDKVRFRVEPVAFSGIFEPELDWMVWRNQQVLGFVPLIPGRCFDPGAWRSVSAHDLHDPILAPKIAHAERELDAQK